MDLHLQGCLLNLRCILPTSIKMFIQVVQFYALFRCEAMSFPEKQAREAWTWSGGEKKKEEEEEEGNEEEKEPAIVDRV